MIDARANNFINGKKPFKVIVSAITLMAFLFNTLSYDLAWAARTPLELTSVGPNRAGGPGLFKKLDVSTFALPESLGHIKDAWSPSSELRPTTYDQRPTIIHIQDAHCNYDAQHKTEEIIGYLNREYGIDVINLEGGAKDYDLSVFTKISDRNIRERVADNFVKEGLISGAEYFVINNPDRATLWGVEDVNLYLENLNVYRESLKYKEEIEKHLKSLNHILSNLKIHIYSKELLELDARYSQYKAGSVELKEYLTYLVRKAKDGLIDTKSFLNIYLLSQALEQEEKIDFKKANNERDGLIDRLQKKLSKNALEGLVLKTLEFKASSISQKDFYAYLVTKAKLVNIEMADFPELQKYIVYISMYDAIDNTKIMDEMDTLEGRIKESLYRNDKERELNKLSKNLALLKNIFNITLTKEDYKYYCDNEESFLMKNYISFIDREAPLYKITARLDDNIAGLDIYRLNLSKFYECSLKRDEAFLKNIRFEVSDERSALVQTQTKNRKPKTTIIVTGGFHTENLCELFKKQGISYVSIMPNFKNGDGYKCPYFSILAGELTGIQKRLYSVVSTLYSSLAIASFVNNNINANLPDGERRRIIFDLYAEWAAAAANGQKGLKIQHGDKSIAIDAKGDIVPVEEAQDFKVAFVTQFAQSLQLSEPAGAITPPAAAAESQVIVPAQGAGKQSTGFGRFFIREVLPFLLVLFIGIFGGLVLTKSIISWAEKEVREEQIRKIPNEQNKFLDETIYNLFKEKNYDKLKQIAYGDAPLRAMRALVALQRSLAEEVPNRLNWNPLARDISDITRKRPEIIQPSTVLLLEEILKKDEKFKGPTYFEALYAIENLPSYLAQPSTLAILEDILKEKRVEHYSKIALLIERIARVQPGLIQAPTLSILENLIRERSAMPELKPEFYSDITSAIVQIARERSELIQQSTLDALEEIMMNDGFSNFTYTSAVVAMKHISKLRPALVRNDSFAEIISSLPDNFILAHPLIQWEIYLNDYFNERTKKISEVNKYSIGLSTYRLLKRLNLELDDSNIRKAADFIMESRSKIAARNIFASGINVINVTHEDEGFDLDGMQYLEKGAGVDSASIKSFKGKDQKEDVLNSIKGNDGPLTIFFMGHGGPRHLWLAEGFVGRETSDELSNPLAISYRELGDALYELHNKGCRLREVVILVDACYSYDFSANLLNYLEDKGINDFPLVVSATNYNTIGYMKVFFDSITKTQQERKGPVTVRDRFKAEEDAFRQQDIGMFMSLQLGELEKIFGKGVSIQPSETDLKEPHLRSLPPSSLELRGPEIKIRHYNQIPAGILEFGFSGTQGQVTTGDLDYFGRIADRVLSEFSSGRMKLPVAVNEKQIKITSGVITVDGKTIARQIDNSQEDFARPSPDGKTVYINRNKLNDFFKNTDLNDTEIAIAIERILIHDIAEALALQLSYSRADAHHAGMMAEAMHPGNTQRIRDALAPVLLERDRLSIVQAFPTYTSLQYSIDRLSHEIKDPQHAVGQVVEKFRNAPGGDLLTLDVHRNLLRTIASRVMKKLKKKTEDVNMVYYPFGGFDPYTPFTLFENATDVISMGYDNFGDVDDIVRFVESCPAEIKAGLQYATYDNWRGTIKADIMTKYGLSGLGALAIARIISFLGGEVKKVSYFDIMDDGTIKYLQEPEIRDRNRCKNAVVEFTVRDANSGVEITKRFWYVQHDVYSGIYYHYLLEDSLGPGVYFEDMSSKLEGAGYIDKSGVIQPSIEGEKKAFCQTVTASLTDAQKIAIREFLLNSYISNMRFTRFANRLKPHALLIKAADGKFTARSDWEPDAGPLGYNQDGFFRVLQNKTTDSAALNNSIVISDEEYNRPVPPPIWIKDPQSIQLEKNETFGYSNPGHRVYFGLGVSLKPEKGAIPESATLTSGPAAGLMKILRKPKAGFADFGGGFFSKLFGGKSIQEKQADELKKELTQFKSVTRERGKLEGEKLKSLNIVLVDFVVGQNAPGWKLFKFTSKLDVTADAVSKKIIDALSTEGITADTLNGRQNFILILYKFLTEHGAEITIKNFNTHFNINMTALNNLVISQRKASKSQSGGKNLGGMAKLLIFAVIAIGYLMSTASLEAAETVNNYAMTILEAAPQAAVTPWGWLIAVVAVSAVVIGAIYYIPSKSKKTVEIPSEILSASDLRDKSLLEPSLDSATMKELIKNLLPLDAIRKIKQVGKHITVEVQSPQEGVAEGPGALEFAWKITVKKAKEEIASLHISDNRKTGGNSLLVDGFGLKTPGKTEPGMPANISLLTLSNLSIFAANAGYDNIGIKVRLTMDGFRLIELYEYAGFKEKIGEDKKDAWDKLRDNLHETGFPRSLNGEFFVQNYIQKHQIPPIIDMELPIAKLSVEKGDGPKGAIPSAPEKPAAAPARPTAEGTKPLIRNGIEYGTFDPNTDTITIDIDKTKEAFKDIAPELGSSNNHIVTGFVHAHEIFHLMVNKIGIKLEEQEEEKLADIFAKKVSGLSPPDEDLAKFAAKVKDVNIENQFNISYDSPEFLLNLRTLGIDIYNIESAPIASVPDKQLDNRERKLLRAIVHTMRGFGGGANIIKSSDKEPEVPWSIAKEYIGAPPEKIKGAIAKLSKALFDSDLDLAIEYLGLNNKDAVIKGLKAKEEVIRDIARPFVNPFPNIIFNNADRKYILAIIAVSEGQFDRAEEILARTEEVTEISADIAKEYLSAIKKFSFTHRPDIVLDLRLRIINPQLLNSSFYSALNRVKKRRDVLQAIAENDLERAKQANAYHIVVELLNKNSYGVDDLRNLLRSIMWNEELTPESGRLKWLLRSALRRTFSNEKDYFEFLATITGQNKRWEEEHKLARVLVQEIANIQKESVVSGKAVSSRERLERMLKNPMVEALPVNSYLRARLTSLSYQMGHDQNPDSLLKYIKNLVIEDYRELFVLIIYGEFFDTGGVVKFGTAPGEWQYVDENTIRKVGTPKGVHHILAVRLDERAVEGLIRQGLSEEKARQMIGRFGIIGGGETEIPSVPGKESPAVGPAAAGASQTVLSPQDLKFEEFNGYNVVKVSDKEGRLWWLKLDGMHEVFTYRMAKEIGVNVPPFMTLAVKDINTENIPEELKDRWNKACKEFGLEGDSRIFLTRDADSLSINELTQQETSGLEELLVFFAWGFAVDVSPGKNMSFPEINGIRRYVTYDLTLMPFTPIDSKYLYPGKYLFNEWDKLSLERFIKAIEKIESMDKDQIKDIAQKSGENEEAAGDLADGLKKRTKAIRRIVATSLRDAYEERTTAVLELPIRVKWGSYSFPTRSYANYRVNLSILDYLNNATEGQESVNKCVNGINSIWEQFIDDIIAKEDKDEFYKLLDYKEDTLINYALENNPYLAFNLVRINGGIKDILDNIERIARDIDIYENYKGLNSEIRKSLAQAIRKGKEISTKLSRMIELLDPNKSFTYKQSRLIRRIDEIAARITSIPSEITATKAVVEAQVAPAPTVGPASPEPRKLTAFKAINVRSPRQRRIIERRIEKEYSKGALEAVKKNGGEIIGVSSIGDGKASVTVIRTKSASGEIKSFALQSRWVWEGRPSAGGNQEAFYKLTPENVPKVYYISQITSMGDPGKKVPREITVADAIEGNNLYDEMVALNTGRTSNISKEDLQDILYQVGRTVAAWSKNRYYQGELGLRHIRLKGKTPVVIDYDLANISQQYSYVYRDIEHLFDQLALFELSLSQEEIRELKNSFLRGYREVFVNPDIEQEIFNREINAVAIMYERPAMSAEVKPQVFAQGEKLQELLEGRNKIFKRSGIPARLVLNKDGTVKLELLPVVGPAAPTTGPITSPLQDSETRKAATVEAFDDAVGKDNDVKVVIGVPIDMNMADVQPTLSEINRRLAADGFGRIEDNKQVVVFGIDVKDAMKTAQNQEGAIGKAREGLSPDGRIVLFAPQMEEDKGPQLAGKAQEDYKGQANIIVVPDAYTDSNPTENRYPDIMVRVALGRNIAFYDTCKEQEGRDSTLAVINRLLTQVADGFAPIVTIDDLLNILRPLRIRPVDYKTITDWQIAQEAVATSL